MTESRALLPDLRGATAKDVLELSAKLNVRFLRLQFTDILGVNKNVELPASQFAHRWWEFGIIVWELSEDRHQYLELFDLPKYDILNL